MKNKFLASILGLALLALVSTHISRASDVRPPPQRWEYGLLFYNTTDLTQPYSWQTKDQHWSDMTGQVFTAHLRNKEVDPKDYFFWAALGEQGWELVGVETTRLGTQYIFKRPGA
jgi:hypothetical protein